MASEFLESKPKRRHRGAKIPLSTPEISIPAADLSARIDMILDGELLPLGFERIRPRLWVESKHPPIRRLFEFQPIKGEVYSARWGFSLDFVPIQKAEKLEAHRKDCQVRFEYRSDRQRRTSSRVVFGIPFHLPCERIRLGQTCPDRRGLSKGSPPRLQSCQFNRRHRCDFP